MAKRRGFFRKAARRSTKFARRAYRAAGKGQPSLLTSALFGAGYGAIRPFAAQLTNYVPDGGMLGSMKDEVVLGTAGYLAAKYGSGIVRNLGRTALIVESASAGAQISSGLTGTSTSSSNNLMNYPI